MTGLVARSGLPRYSTGLQNGIKMPLHVKQNFHAEIASEERKIFLTEDACIQGHKMMSIGWPSRISLSQLGSVKVPPNADCPAGARYLQVQ